VVAKAPPDTNSRGGFPKSAFTIDLAHGTAICPAGAKTTRTRRRQATGEVQFHFSAEVCAACVLRSRCTSSPVGRKVTVGPYEELLSEARIRQRTDQFKAIYNGKRPTVERVISRLVRRGGRKARYRGRDRVAEQIALKAAGENLLRMLRLGLTWTPEGLWVTP